MKKYETPDAEMFKLNAVDVITLSESGDCTEDETTGGGLFGDEDKANDNFWTGNG